MLCCVIAQLHPYRQRDDLVLILVAVIKHCIVQQKLTVVYMLLMLTLVYLVLLIVSLR